MSRMRPRYGYISPKAPRSGKCRGLLGFPCDEEVVGGYPGPLCPSCFEHRIRQAVKFAGRQPRMLQENHMSPASYQDVQYHGGGGTACNLTGAT